MFENSCRNIVIIVIIILILAFLYIQGKTHTPEQFHPTAYNSYNPINLQKKYADTHYNYNNQPCFNANDILPLAHNPNDTMSRGIKDLTIDTMTCSPKCCGDNWHTSFDGLSPDEIQNTIATNVVNDGGPYVRTNYTCANGPDGAGCPCITKKAYTNLMNRGQSSTVGSHDIDPTFHVGRDVHSTSVASVSPYHPASNKSVFVNHPKRNDLELSRIANNLSHLKSHSAY